MSLYHSVSPLSSSCSEPSHLSILPDDNDEDEDDDDDGGGLLNETNEA